MHAGYHPSGNGGRGKNAGKKRGEKSLKEQGFYHTTAWRRVRKLALQRDHYLCTLKKSSRCTGVATEVHHVVPLDQAPELGLELGNLVSCCWWCHEATKPRGRRPDTSRGVRVIRMRSAEEEER